MKKIIEFKSIRGYILMIFICFTLCGVNGTVLQTDSILVIEKDSTVMRDTRELIDSVGDTLQELVVTKELVEDDGMTKTYLITKDMLAKSFNTAKLIDNLPGMKVDMLNYKITYLGRDKIKILVDSIEKSDTHIKRLNPKRFEKVEVTVMPTGRYADYDVLINLKLKPAYTGSEFQVSSLDVLNPNYLRKDKFALLDQSILFDYMRNGWNFYVDGNFDWSYDEEEESYENHYLLDNIIEKSIPNPKGVPTTHSYSRGGKLSLNLDYIINAHHVIGGVYSWAIANNDAFGHSEYNEENLVTNFSNKFTSTNTLRTDNTSHFAGLFYEGRNIGGWFIGAKANFYVDHSKSDNSYQRTSGYNEIYLTRPAMNYTFLGANVSRWFFGRLKMNFDYNFINRNRYVRDLEGIDLSRLKENRQYASLGLDMPVGNKTHLSGGIWYLNDHVLSSGIRTITNELGFRFTGRHTFNDYLSFRLSYSSNSKVPTSSQLSDYGQFVNPYLFVGGNPELKTGKLHFLTADIDFLEYFTLSGGYLYFKNYIGTIALEKNGLRPDGEVGKYVIRQPVNYDISHRDISLSFDKDIDPFNINASIGYSYSVSTHKDISIHKGYVEWDAEVSYSCSPWHLDIALAYDSPQKYSITSPQVWMKNETDEFRIKFNKRFLRGNLFVAVHYTLPIHLYSNKEYTYMSSPVLVSDKMSNMRLSDNRLSISVTYMLNSGNRISRFRKVIHEEQ